MNPDASQPSRHARRSYWLLVLVAMLAGVALRSSALSGTLYADDWDHYAMDAGIYPVARNVLDHYDFIAASDAERHALLRTGRLPWWTDREIHLSVWRPLSSALLWFDFHVLDAAHHPTYFHWHSLIWWLTLVAGVAAVLGAVLPLSAAALAVSFYTIDDAHILPFSWTANRSELVSLALVMWAFWAHLRWRSHGRIGHRVLSLLLVALGLLAGEHALPALFYIVLFECWSTRSGRLRALLPVLALIALYLVARLVFGYGVGGSSYYVDPFSEPARFLVLSLTRLPVLIADVVFGWPSEAWYWAPRWTSLLGWLPTRWLSFALMRRLQVGAGVTAFGLLACLLVRLRRARSNPTAAALGWLVLGAIAALLPALGTLPMSRLTAAAAIGIDAAFGCGLLWLISRLRAHSLTQRAGVLVLIAAVLYLQAVRPAQRSYEEGSFYSARGHVEQAWVLGADLEGDLSDKELFIISAHDWATACALPAVRHLHGLSMPASSQVLTPVPNSPHKLTRVARNILDVRIVRAPPVGTFSASVYRSERAAFRVGDVIRTPLLGAVVMEMRGRDPILVRFFFPMPLDDPHYVFLYPVDAGLRRLQLPEVGQSVVLPAAAWPL